MLVDVIGKDKVILGTDYPFPLGEVTGYGGSYPGKAIMECETFNNELKKKLLFDNAMNFLGLDSSFFY